MKTSIPPALITLALACFALLPKAHGVLPPPDGGYPGFNTAEGQNALFNLTTGAANTAVGWYSLFSNTEGSFNTATGAGALLFNTSNNNTAFGAAALLFNTIGGGNTAVGTAALLNNTEGGANTAIGVQALNANTTGTANTAIGAGALVANTEGDGNVAVGVEALTDNTTGTSNAAFGDSALVNNVDGGFNTAVGTGALSSNTIGNGNTATGYHALLSNSGEANTANGFQALLSNTTGGNNTAIGTSALDANTTGNENTALGAAAGFGITTANSVICIGTGGANVSNSCFIGHIRGVTTANANAIPVLIDSAGQLGTVSSSRRFKHEIEAMDNASEVIHALKPVTFHYKSDNTSTPQFGLIAEEVAQVNPELVVRDENGEIYTVRYDAVNAMLLNEFLKEHRKVENLEKAFQTTFAQQQREIAALTATVKEQAVQIQKVSAQVEVKSASEEVAVNKQ